MRTSDRLTDKGIILGSIPWFGVILYLVTDFSIDLRCLFTIDTRLRQFSQAHTC